ncbi:hypothetical protein STSP2_01505 [Anaerohalosphaera lusitana]|uniref:Dockerin domain-containing protein n=1 Tax=Anaerohalosphaera lusitana TaxID=1936003 RepID=A0A1U9NLH6_9BACT|nr:dockerin type I domain-containing protein [Anaerohalosphaera lusitana]AQT68346.1 hypothetical protein STSP2_01505 [Anaerohalosphaera lusitana]
MMKRVLLLALCMLVNASVPAAPNMNVFRADGETPLEYQEIMVGTQLTLVISNDNADYWSGSVALYDPNIPMADITGREYNGFSYDGSCLPASGFGSAVYDWTEQGVRGFDLYAGYTGVTAGDWFVLDYKAVQVGECTVQMHEHNMPDGPAILIDEQTFIHVPTRDFNADSVVDYSDLVVMSRYWGQTDVADPSDVKGADLNEDGAVDMNDLLLFSCYWLEKTG